MTSQIIAIVVLLGGLFLASIESPSRRVAKQEINRRGR